MKKALITLALAALAAFAGQPLQKTDGSTFDKISAYYENKGEAKLEQLEFVIDQSPSTLLDRAWEAYRAGDAEKMYDYATYTGFMQLVTIDRILGDKESLAFQLARFVGNNNVAYSLVKVVYPDKNRPYSDDMRLVIVYSKMNDKWKISNMLWYDDTLDRDTKKQLDKYLSIKPKLQKSIKPLF